MPPADKAQAFYVAHKKTAQALSSWHCLGKIDLTSFEGISLGLLHRIHLVEPLSFLFHQAAKGLDPASPDFMKNSWARKYRPAAKPLPLRRMDWKALTFRIFYALCALRPKASGARSVLILASPSNRMLWNYWLNHFSEEKSIRLDFMLNYPPGLANGLYSVLRGSKVFDPKPAQLSAQQNRAIQGIRSALRQLQRNEEWRELFRMEGADFSEIFIRDHLNPFLSQLETLAQKYLSLAQEFSRHNSDLILLPQEVSADARILMALGKKHGTPVWFLNHGFPGAYSSDENLQCGYYEADRILAWGEQDKRNYLRAAVPENKLIVAGLPAFDSFFPTAQASPFQQIRGSTVMLLAYSAPWVTYFDDNEETYFLDVVRLLDRLGAKRILFKLHPGRAYMNFYQQLLSGVRLKSKVEFLQFEGFLSVLRRADWVIGGISTAIFETLLSGKDYFLLHYDPGNLIPYDIYPPFESSRPYVARTIRQLEKNLLEGRPLPRADILRDFCGIEGKEQAWHFSRKVFDELKSALA